MFCYGCNKFFHLEITVTAPPFSSIAVLAFAENAFALTFIFVFNSPFAKNFD